MPSPDVDARMGMFSANITPRAARIVLMVRELGNAKRAAMVLKISKENVCTTMRIVEAKFGVQLFTRKRGVATSWERIHSSRTTRVWAKLENVLASNPDAFSGPCSLASHLGLERPAA